MNILLIEDDVGLVDLITENLEALGFSVRSTTSGAEALAHLEEQTPDLMLLDYSLPDISGKELIQTLIDQPATPPPFIITTGQGDERIAVEMMKLGALDYVVKDRLFLERLPDVVQRVVNEIQSEGRLRLAEEALKESEARFRTISENAPVLINSFDKDGRCLFWNTQCQKTFGWTIEEINEQDVGMALFYPDTALCEEAISSVTTDPDGHFREWHPVTKDGKTLSIMWANFGLPNGQVFSMGHDITERKQAEAQKDRLTAAVEQSAESIVITNAEGVIEYINPAFERITGYSLADTLGNTPRMLKSGKQDEAFYSDLWRTIASGEIWRGQMVNKRQNGGFYTESNVISSVKDSAGKIVNYVAVKTDITRELIREEKSRQALKMEAIGQLAGGIAHDFNNQLSGILGYAEILIDSLNDEQQIRDATLIKEGALRAADLTAQLLAFSHKGKALSSPVNIHKLIAEVADILAHSISKQVTIKQALHADPETTLGDPNQLQNVLLNLAINARDAMPDGGELIFDTAVAELDEDFLRDHPMEVPPGTYLMITVSDNGCGMDAETQKHIFEPFYTTKAVGKGTGMGLASVYGTIHNHKGVINVYSEIGHGTTFRIYLPLIDDAHSQEQIESKSQPIAGTARILLVDDEELIRKFATRALERLGYHVISCSNGKEAVDCYAESWREIDLVLLDMIMPVMGGREAFARMKEINPEVLTVLSSGYSINGEAQTILDAGVKAFIRKPYQLIELSEKVAEVLHGEDAASEV